MTYAVLLNPRGAKVSAGPGYVAARLTTLEREWRWVTHPLDVRPSETLCVSLGWHQQVDLRWLRCRRIVVGGCGVAWGGRVTASCPVVHVTGSIENLTHAALESSSDVHLGWKQHGLLTPVFPSGYLDRNTRFVGVDSGRGCSWGRCIFCSVARSSVDMFERDAVETASVARAIWKNTGTPIRLSQECPSSKWLDRFAQAMPGDVPWVTFARADQLTDELVKSLARGGCSWVCLGAEYLSDSVLELLQKGQTVAQIVEAHGRLVSAGINALLDFIDLDAVVTDEQRQEHHRNLAWFGHSGDHLGFDAGAYADGPWWAWFSSWSGEPLDGDQEKMSQFPGHWLGACPSVKEEG